jgi:hypothetical protein
MRYCPSTHAAIFVTSNSDFIILPLILLPSRAISTLVLPWCFQLLIMRGAASEAEKKPEYTSKAILDIDLTIQRSRVLQSDESPMSEPNHPGDLVVMGTLSDSNLPSFHCKTLRVILSPQTCALLSPGCTRSWLLSHT